WPDRLFLDMTFANKSAESIDIRSKPEREILRRFVGKGGLDIQERQCAEGRGCLEWPIVRPASDRAERRGQPNSDRKISQSRHSEIFQVCCDVCMPWRRPCGTPVSVTASCDACQTGEICRSTGSDCSHHELNPLQLCHPRRIIVQGRGVVCLG